MHQAKPTYYNIFQFWIVGLLTGLFTGLLTFVLYFGFNLVADRSFSFLFILIYLLPAFGMYYAVIRLRNRYGRGVIKFNQAFRLALLTGFVAAVVMGLLVYFIYTYMSPQGLESRMSYLEAAVLKEGHYLAQDIRQLRSLIKTLLSPVLMAFSIFVVNLVLSLLFAFIIAIFARRKDRYIDL